MTKFFKRISIARLRHDRSGIVLGHSKINNQPYIRVRINKRNGEGTIDKHIHYRDVMLITKFPSAFQRIFLFRKPKFFTVKLTEK